MAAPEAQAPALAGVRILDFTHGVAGPYAVMLLADLGAEVWKIEKPERGDPTRYMNVSAAFKGDIPRSGGDYFLAINRNKQSVAIDLQRSEGRELALRLAANADIVVSNFRPGVMERLGLGYEDVLAVNDQVIYATMSAYGEAGPLAHQPGMDVAVQARSGVMAITGDGRGGPVKPGASVADFSGGAHLTIAVLAALARRATRSGGQRLHVSLLDSMVSMLMNYSVAVIDGGAEIKPMGSGHPQLVPFQAFPTSDGYLVVSTGTNRLFAELCEALGRSELSTDPRFRTNVDRVANRDELVPMLAELTAARTTGHWLTLFETLGIPCSPVNTLAQAFAEEQLAAQGMIVEVKHPALGPIHVIAAPYTFDGSRPQVSAPPPTLGEHTAVVLRRVAEVPEDSLARLQGAGVIGGAALSSGDPAEADVEGEP